MPYLSADYSNADQLVFCDASGVPCDLADNEFLGVASFQGAELVEQFTEINGNLIEAAKEQVAAFVVDDVIQETVEQIPDGVPAEDPFSDEPPAEESVSDEPPADEPVEESPTETITEDVPAEEAVVEDVPMKPFLDQSELSDAGVPDGLLDELASKNLATKQQVLDFHAEFGLQSISGIGEASEKKILDALTE